MRVKTGRATAVAAVLGLSLVAAGCAGGSPSNADGGDGAGVTDINFMVDWLWGTQHTGFIVAQELGYFEEEGLNVHMEEGEGSTITSQLVASNDMNFGYVASGVALQGVDSGMPISTVATILKDTPHAIIWNKDRIDNVETIEDLSGYTLGVAMATAAGPDWDAVVAASGADISGINVVNVGDTVVPALVDGKADAIVGYSFNQGTQIETMGFDLGYLMMSDHGLEVPGTGIIVNDEFATANPEVVEGFVRAAHRGWEYTIENPEEALDIYMAEFPRAELEWEQLRLDQIVENFLDQEGNIGTVDRDRYENLIGQYADLGLTKTDVDIDDLVDDSFINNVLG